jgi:hypothetical protein
MLKYEKEIVRKKEKGKDLEIDREKDNGINYIFMSRA